MYTSESMSHQTFYRKYRSQTFADLVGQDHIIQTLKNAMSHDRLTHAYIFSGPRGTGKTSTARILAKSMNCREGMSDSPCLTCDLCQKIAQGTAVDVVEIDAASNTGVDNIRTLNDQVNFAPVECRTKIYIIDEAHMLSSGAFNALLKTLEEPPENTLFILATTEPHKLPITIHSRCQHLHFRLMSTQETVSQLQHIAQSESIEIDEPALTTIARNAGGSMRDAVSLFDQIYAFKGTQIGLDDVLLSLGASNLDSLIALMQHFFSKDTQSTLKQLTELMDQGLNMTQLIGDILDILKQLLFVKMSLSDQLDLDEGRLNQLKTLAKKTDVTVIKDALSAFAKAEVDLKWFPNPALLLQVTFLTQLHQPTAAPVAPAAPAPSAPAPSHNQAPAPVQARTPQPAPPARQPSAPQARPAPSASAGPFSLPDIPVKRDPAAPTPVAPPTQPQPTRQQPAQPRPVSSNASNAQPAQSGSSWDTCQNIIRDERHALYALLKGSHVEHESESELVVALKQDFKFFREKLKESSNKAFIETIIKRVYEKPLAFKLSEGGSSPLAQSATTTPQAAVPTPQPVQTRVQAPSPVAPTPTQHSAPATDTTASPFAAHMQSETNETDKRINQIIQMFDGELIH